MEYSMFYERFIDGLKGLLPEEFKKLPIKTVTVVKGGQQKEGIILGGLKVSPVLYIIEEFKQYELVENAICDKDDFAFFVQMRTKPFIEALEKHPEKDYDPDDPILAMIQNGNIVLNLVNGANQEYLDTVPHIDWHDIAGVFRVWIDEDHSFVVTNELVLKYHLSMLDLVDLAYKNTKELGLKIQTLDSVVAEFIGGGEFGQTPNTVVVTNDRFVNGATTMIFSENLKKVGEELGTKKFLILPSSVHEFIAIPMEDAEATEAAYEMVREINHTVVDPEDVLSDNVYIVDLDKKSVTPYK